MAVLAFRRHGRQRVDRIQAVLQQRIDHWHAQWAAEPGGCQVMALSEAAPAPDGQWWRCSAQHIHLWLPEQGSALLGSALAAVPRGQGTDLAAAIGARALVDLMLELGAPAAEVTFAPGASQLDRRHGVLGFALELPGTVAMVYLSIGVCDAIAPPTIGVAAPALAPRRQALLASTTRMIATLDLGDAPLDAASSLRTGEILSGSRIADAIVRVHDVAGNTVFIANLHSADGRKALRCTHVEHQTGRE